ncbi:hypothetical protein Q9L42_018360 [Methylomarinum sp. Ch1-1]|uniref:Protein translocase subunit SecA n=1 Tax=Methylomarinum roseum TaxID=3067653 RepID=A0AAU7NTJ9_9GAMM|nr:hypothetical protein [Methylomarinum sp. Ch1-1]MDP4519659.1 hypothetical protein [Methylomarinum sp. Ch1-1]
MVDSPLRPGLMLGAYPQQAESNSPWLEAWARRSGAAIKHRLRRHRYTLRYIVGKVNQYQHAFGGLSDAELQAQVRQLQQRLHVYGLSDELIQQAFAAIREAADRVLGKRHFDVQLLGGWVMINGMVAEMETGEGKTLTTALPACTAALAGVPVHVMTANDYLATRDEQQLRPLFRWLGIDSAVVTEAMNNESRRRAYRRGIVYAAGQQIAFDYLRDRMAMGNQQGKMQLQFKHVESLRQGQPAPFLLRGLCFAIVDEADSLLIDEAKTPLIISRSRQHEQQARTCFDALSLAASLHKGSDFHLDAQRQQVTLTSLGQDKLTILAESMAPCWRPRRQREHRVTLALKAKYLFLRDEHYLLRNGKVEIIDALTGRVMPGRNWEQGLQQLIEAKEGCEMSAEREPLAKMSYQRFFSRYLRLAGTSGTVKEVAGELNHVYGLRVITVPTHRPSRRETQAERLYKNSEQRWRAFVQRVESLQRQGRPVLIGARTVAQSENISALLADHGLQHQVLNAHQDKREAELIAKAGQRGCITVATNMAGRGTDIALGDGVAELGGLQVISTGRNDARRIDRQLHGRCARQGDPGSVVGYLSLEDDKLISFYPQVILKLAACLCPENKPLAHFLAAILLSWPQKWTEYQHYRLRCQLMKRDKQQAKIMAFSGPME